MTTKITAQNFQEEVVESEIPVIMDFWAEWCGPCQMMGPVFEELSEEYNGKLKFCKVNTESEPALANHFEVRGIPCLIIAKDGDEVDRIVGFAPKVALKEQIDKILNK